ncbi:unnamed protein product [Blepharisma stoltei]|uniref:Uncharacterized protein n=1 Tax=Blepharisma stoltei TaxID=1481888 RepID=A0AAU9IWR0_9CILI|nr:unnamed protein product [Blepharisma stoltei]
MKQRPRLSSHHDILLNIKQSPNQIQEDVFYLYKKRQPFSLSNQLAISPISDRPPLYPTKISKKFIRNINSYCNSQRSSSRSSNRSSSQDSNSSLNDSNSMRSNFSNSITKKHLKMYHEYFEQDKENASNLIDLSSKIKKRINKNAKEIFSKEEKQEAFDEYKDTQEKINKISKGRLPSTFLFKISTKRF